MYVRALRKGRGRGREMGRCECGRKGGNERMRDGWRSRERGRCVGVAVDLGDLGEARARARRWTVLLMMMRRRRRSGGFEFDFECRTESQSRGP